MAARLDAAIELVTADTPVERQIGDELLADLIESDLGSDEDRTLARRIARIRLGEQLGAARTRCGGGGPRRAAG